MGAPITNIINKSIFYKNENSNYFFKNIINFFSKSDYYQIIGSLFHSKNIYRTFNKKRDNLFEFEFEYNLDSNLENIEKYIIKNKFINKIKNLLYFSKIHCPTHAQFMYYTTIKNPQIPIFVLIPYFINFIKKSNYSSGLFKTNFSINTDPNYIFILDKDKVLNKINLNKNFNLYLEAALSILNKKLKINKK